MCNKKKACSTLNLETTYLNFNQSLREIRINLNNLKTSNSSAFHNCLMTLLYPIVIRVILSMSYE